MPDYSNTVIYKIFCKNTNVSEIYIGHSTDFNNRKSKHKYSCNNENDKRYNLKVYHYIRENGGWDNFEMVIIEKYPCNDIYKAIEREKYFVKELKASLNNNIPGRTEKEYKKDNKEKIKEYYIINKKEYYLNNKNEINEKKKEKIICECGSEIRKSDLKRHQQSAKHINLMTNK